MSDLVKAARELSKAWDHLYALVNGESPSLIEDDGRVVDGNDARDRLDAALSDHTPDAETEAKSICDHIEECGGTLPNAAERIIASALVARDAHDSATKDAETVAREIVREYSVDLHGGRFATQWLEKEIASALVAARKDERRRAMEIARAVAELDMHGARFRTFAEVATYIAAAIEGQHEPS